MNTEIISTPEAALAMTKAEIDIQISTAKTYPRKLDEFKARCESMVAISPEVAASCNYALTRSNKTIEGPSVRLAEIIQNNWGNMRTGAKVLEESGDFVVVQGACHDLESNVAVTVEVKRRIADKKGKRYNLDMIQTTTAAAISIAIRNAVFKIVPNVYTKHFSDVAKTVALGKPESFNDRVKKAFEFFTDWKVSEDKILEKLGIEKKTQMTKAHLLTLQGIATAVRDNMTTIENEFPEKMKEPQAGETKAGELSAEDLIVGGTAGNGAE